MARDGNGKLPWKAIARKKVKKYNYKTKCVIPFFLFLSMLEIRCIISTGITLLQKWDNLTS